MLEAFGTVQRRKEDPCHDPHDCSTLILIRIRETTFRIAGSLSCELGIFSKKIKIKKVFVPRVSLVNSSYTTNIC